MKKIIPVTIAACLVAVFANGEPKRECNARKHKCEKECRQPMARFGVITDIHHTNKPDIPSRKYSAALRKTASFVKTMNNLRADFIIELGDLVDLLAQDKNPIQNLTEVESLLARFDGPRFHVLGNHEFDNVARNDMLSHIENTGIPAGNTWYSFDNHGIHGVVLDADYTVAEPHRPFDLQDPADPFWNWQDAWIPQDELDWLTADLAASDYPTIVFCHQLFHRADTEDHTIKNASVVRSIFENDGQVLAVFSGHDHRGEIAFINGIHYLVLEGNVGMSLDRPEVSPTEGMHPEKDSPYSLVEITELKKLQFDGKATYRISITGNAQQYSFEDQIVIKAGNGR